MKKMLFKNIYLILLFFLTIPITSHGMKEGDYACNCVGSGTSVELCSMCNDNKGSVRDIGNGDLHCESGYVGSANSGNIYLSINGFPCTYSEVLEATALFGNWVKASNAPFTRDNVLVGGQVIIWGIIQIFRKFNGGQGIYKGMERFKMDCAMEYISHKCRLENVTHYCFADWDVNQDNDPRLRWKSEEQRQQVKTLLEKMKEEGQI